MTIHTTKVKSFSESAFTPAVDTPASEDLPHLDLAVNKVHEAAPKFAKLTIGERIDLARAMQQGYLKIAEKSVALACKAKGIVPNTPMEGEEWASGPVAVVRHLRLIREQLASVKKTGNTTIGKVEKTVSDNLSVRTFPASPIDALLLRGVTIDVHMQRGITAEQMTSSRAGFYKKPSHEGGTVLILGAGNFASIPVMDVITKMFNEGKVCVLKMNPVNAYLGPLIEEAFQPAVDRGYLTVVYGGVKEGDYLVKHARIDEIHITGSDRTYESIVWGPAGPAREKRVTGNAPLLRKPITAELGNVSPVIITPGPYTSRELKYLAEDIAGYLTMNSSFICCAAKILIVPKGWDKRAEFLSALEDILKKIAPRKAYYPGTAERYATFVNERSSVIKIGEATEGALPWTILSGLDANDASEPLFTTESFCPILGETAVGSMDVAGFMKAAVDFANNRLWGTLSSTLVVHPKIASVQNLNKAIEWAIDHLKYGTVCVNAFPGMSFAFASPPWGAYPGSTSVDIQSGQGWVHNTAMLEGIEKVVARFPFMSFPKPAYFPSHGTVHKMMRKMTALEEKGSWAKVPGIMLTALRG